MDASRFDAWTRRRFGRAVGGLATIVVGGTTLTDVAAKKKRRKRCKRLFARCTPGGKRKCCNRLKCRVPYDIQDGSSSETHCCRLEGESCSVNNDCCYPSFCSSHPEPGGECVVNSDRALKANFGSVDPADMLTRVRDLPISTWNYTSDDASVRHIGPMAQDFAATFGVGSDDRHIHPVDGQGVALAAIQAVAAELERLRAENAALSDRLAALEQSRD